jgi:hypothetical protein
MTNHHRGSVTHLSKLVLKDPDSSIQELSLMLSQCDDPLFLLELRVACHQELLTDLSSLEYDLKCILPLCSLYLIML